MVMTLCETQAVLASIWTRVTVSISYDKKHYITAHLHLYIHIMTVYGLFFMMETYLC